MDLFKLPLSQSAGDKGIIVDRDGDAVAMTCGYMPRDEGRAAQMVVACNSHEYMIQTLQEIKRAAETSKGSGAMTCNAIAAMAIAALHAVGGDKS